MRAFLALPLAALCFVPALVTAAPVADLPSTVRVVVVGGVAPTSIFLAPGRVGMDCWAQNYDDSPRVVDITTVTQGASLGPPHVERVLDAVSTPNTSGKESYQSLGKEFWMVQGEELFASVSAGATVLVGCNVRNP